MLVIAITMLGLYSAVGIFVFGVCLWQGIGWLKRENWQPYLWYSLLGSIGWLPVGVFLVWPVVKARP
jgi:hypothetical protein